MFPLMINYCSPYYNLYKSRGYSSSADCNTEAVAPFVVKTFQPNLPSTVAGYVVDANYAGSNLTSFACSTFQGSPYLGLTFSDGSNNNDYGVSKCNTDNGVSHSLIGYAASYSFIHDYFTFTCGV